MKSIVLYRCIKRQKHNIKLLRSFDLSKKGLSADEKWIYDNKIKLMHLCGENIKALKRIDILPTHNKELRVYSMCKKAIETYAYDLTERGIISFLGDVQSDGGRLLINELYSLKPMLRCVLFDAIGSELEGTTRGVIGLAVQMIYELDNIDFQRVFDECSAVYRVLEHDPSGVFDLCDRTTKERYLMTLARSAKKLRVDECELAEQYLRAAEKSEGKAEHIGYHILKRRGNVAVNIYDIAKKLTATIAVAILALLSYRAKNVLLVISSILCYLPIRRTTKMIFDLLISRKRPIEMPPRLQINEIPKNAKTLLTFTVSLSGKSNDKQLFDKLLLYARAYNKDNLSFAILADLPDSNDENDPRDEEIIEHAKMRIDEIRRCNGAVSFLYRRRTYSESEGKFIGRERKRGAQEELVSYIVGRENELISYGESDLSGVRYLLALDADTEIMRNDILRLIATAAHPLNRPEFAVDAGGETVVNGYGVFVPRAVMSLKNTSKRDRYTVLKTAFEGRSAYESAVFSPYTALTDEGVYCGKGLIDVEAYDRVLSGRFPNGKILSHDIAEGAFLRAAAVSDATVFDSPPSSLISERKRLHRWIRGDIQSLILAKRRLRKRDGMAYPNPLPVYKRRLLMDAAREHFLLAVRVPAELTALFGGGALGVIIYIFSVADHIFESTLCIIAALRTPRREYASGAPELATVALFDSMDFFLSKGDRTCLAIDAVIRAYYRMYVSHRGLLEWTVSAVADAQASGSKAYAKALKTNVVLGVLSIMLAPLTTPVAAALLILNAISRVIYPIYAYRQSDLYLPSQKAHNNTGTSDDIARMWRFFVDNVTEKTGFLPPDNIAYFPEKRLAHRTSPTNIGLYLMSVLNAFDFGLIGSDELWRRLTETLTTVTSLEKYRGHLYNWYDTDTKRPLAPIYVSTVDSGNLAVSLLTVKSGISRLGALFDKPTRMIESLLDGMDFSFLYSEKRGLFHIGCDVTHSMPDANFYDLYPSEMLTTVYYAAAKGQIPASALSSLGRIFSDSSPSPVMLSWSGSAFEYFMPSIWLGYERLTERGDMLLSATKKQRLSSSLFEGEHIYGMSESAYYDFDEQMNFAYKAHGVPPLALSHDSPRDRVYAPYSLYLMLGADDYAEETLDSLKKTSLYGKYGFYDALDMTLGRVTDEGAVVRQYMAHHIGMSIAALANYSLDCINVKRFFDDPEMCASVHLLLSKNEICRPLANDALHLPTVPRAAVSDRGEIIRQGAAIVSNGFLKIYADDSGETVFLSGETLLTRPRDGDVRGFGVLIRLDGEIYDCLSGGKTGVKRGFSYDGGEVTYESDIMHGDSVIRTSVSMALDPESETAAVSVNVLGCTSPPEILVYAFPVLEKRCDYKSAPAYSDLFLTVEKDTDTTLFKRRKKSGDTDEMSISVTPSPMKTVTDISRIAAFPLRDGFAERIFDAHEDVRLGAAVNPFFCAVTKGDLCEVCIKHGEGDAAHRDFFDIVTDAQKRFRLFSAYAGADSSAVAAASRLVGGIYDHTSRLTEYCGEGVPHYKRDILWRHGISGDLPLAVCFANAGSSASKYAFDELLRAKRFLFVSGVRFDLIVIADDVGYTGGELSTLVSLAKADGCEKLLGKNNGIFMLGKSKLTDNDLSVITALASHVVGKSDGDIIRRLPHFTANETLPPTRFVRRRAETIDTGVRVSDGISPVPWTYVYANAVFGSLLTNKTAGFTWYRNSSLGAVSARHTDALTGTPGEKLMLETKNGRYDLLLWSDKVEYRTDCALYSGEADGIAYMVRIGVDARLPVKLYHLTLDGALDGASLRLYVIPSAKCILGGSAVTLMKEPQTSFELTVLPKERASVEAFSDAMSVTAPAEEKTAFLLAASPTVTRKKVFDYVKRKYHSPEAVLYGFDEYGRALGALIKFGQYTGGEKYLADMLGGALRQAYLYRIRARTGYYQSGGAYGYRDQLQDSLAALYFSPELTKRQILRSCAHQYTDGRAQHWWHTDIGGLRSRCSDDYMWLPYVTAEYVLSTGDFDILSLRVPFLSSPPLRDGEEDRYEKPPHTRERFTVLEHCLRAFDASRTVGAHSLPLMLSGDWNDGMNGIGARGRGESVWLAFFFAVTARRFSEMLRLYGNGMIETAEKLDSYASGLISTAEDAWDGNGYIRAYDDDGRAVGSESSEECKLDILPQAFSVFAGADRDRAAVAMETLYTHLYKHGGDGKNGILRLFAPSFDKMTDYGYITRYPAGIRENGGQYTHAAVWAARAFFKLGAYRRGKEILRFLTPQIIYENGAFSGKYTAEPYLICADVYYGDGITGKSGWSGYTGSAAWYYTTAMKYLFGVEFYLGCLVITPRPYDVTGDYRLTFTYNSHKIAICAVYGDECPDEGFDYVAEVRVGERGKVGKITEDIKILLKIRN